MKKRASWFKWSLSIFSATDDIPYTAAEFVSKANNSRNRAFILVLLILFWLCLVSLLLTSIAFFSNNNTLFNVSVTSEKAQISSFESSKYPDWKIISAKFEDYEDYEEFASGTVTINPNASITFERVGKQPLVISIEGPEEAGVATLMLDDGSVKTFIEGFFIYLQPTAENPITLPFDGNISLGGEVKEGTAPMPVLLNGTISIADKAALSQEYYTAAPIELKLGDVLSIDNPSTRSSGFIYVDDDPAIKITFSGKGSQATIQRFKAEPIHLKNGFWTKLVNDETLIFLWLFLGALYTVIKIMIRLNLESDETETTARKPFSQKLKTKKTSKIC